MKKFEMFWLITFFTSITSNAGVGTAANDSTLAIESVEVKSWTTILKDIEGDDGELSLVLPIPLVDLKVTCDGSVLFLLDEGSLKFKNKKGEISENSYSTGSAGNEYKIYSFNPKSKQVKVLFEKNLIEIVSKPIKVENCPSFHATVHGSEFKKVGYDYQEVNLVYNKKKSIYEWVLKKKIK